jgi:hypothetical protein
MEVPTHKAAQHEAIQKQCETYFAAKETTKAAAGKSGRKKEKITTAERAIINKPQYGKGL